MSNREPLGQAELEQAKAAYAQKRYGEAREYCRLAERAGATRGSIQQLERAIRVGEEQQKKLTQSAGFVGFLFAFFAYIILAFLPLPTPAHFGAALILIPAICGIAIGRLSGFDYGSGSRFRRAAWVAASTMFVYGIAHMIWRRTRYEMGTETGQVFIVWLVAAGVYAIIAGLVAGVVGGKLTWLGGRKENEQHGTVS